MHCDAMVNHYARLGGYSAYKPTKLEFPKFKSNMYTWIYIVSSNKWNASDQERLNYLDSSINWVIERDPNIAFKDGKVHPMFREGIYYSGQVRDDLKRLVPNMSCFRKPLSQILKQ